MVIEFTHDKPELSFIIGFILQSNRNSLTGKLSILTEELKLKIPTHNFQGHKTLRCPYQDQQNYDCHNQMISVRLRQAIILLFHQTMDP